MKPTPGESASYFLTLLLPILTLIAGAMAVARWIR